MKVVTPGTLLFTSGGGVWFNEWHFDSDGQPPIADSQENARVMLAAALSFVAHQVGLYGAISAHPPKDAAAPPAPDDEAPRFEHCDAQRETLDVIAMARWREQEG